MKERSCLVKKGILENKNLQKYSHNKYSLYFTKKTQRTDQLLYTACVTVTT